MDTAVGSVKQIVELALAIKEAVEMVHQNKDVCTQIGNRVTILSAILSLLGNTETMKHPAMSAALDHLKETLDRALKLVTACQAKHIVSHFFTAKSLSKDLHQVNRDIMDQMGIAIFANGVQNTIMINEHNIQDRVHNPFQKDGVHPAPPKDAGKAESSRSSHSADDTRFEVNGEKKKVAASGSEAAPISSHRRVRKFRLSELKAATSNFSEENIIPGFSFATVYKGVLCDGLEVAIKKFSGSHGKRHIEHCLNVSSVLLKHENVLSLLGYCYEKRQNVDSVDSVWMVEEYMPNGSLYKIKDEPFLKLDWSSTFRIIRGMAQGVAYLHTKNIIHLDLKPEHILLDSDMNPKICDFGKSKILDKGVIKTSTKELVGSRNCMAPEYIADGIISVKNDVYSFGILVLLYSIAGMSLSDPWQYLFKMLVEAEEINELLDPSLCGLKEIKRCINIGLLCTERERRDRPTMPDVLEMLDGKQIVPNRSAKIEDIYSHGLDNLFCD